MESSSSKIIVLVINCLQGCGAEKSVLTLAEGFYQLGYEVHVLRFKPRADYDLSPHIHFHVLRFHSYKFLMTRAMRYKIFARSVDKYILKHIGKPLLTISNLERADKVLSHSKLPNVFHVIRNTMSEEINFSKIQNKQINLNELRKIYQNHQCIAISEGVALDFKKTLGLENIETVYNPIDADAIQQMAEEYSVADEDFFVHVGKFKYQKAHDTLLKAYAKTSKRYPLYLVGQGQLMEDMKQLATELDIISHVKFIGFKSNPYPYIKNAKFLVLCSRFEGFGRVIAEALAVDTPVISTNCPYGPSELLPAKNLVAVDDVDALARLLDKAMQAPQDFSVPFDKAFLPINIASQYLALLDVMPVDKQST